MLRAIYAATWCISYLVSNFVLLWFLAGTISNGVADRLPGKSAISCIVAVLILIAAGLAPRLVPSPPNARRGLNVQTAKTILAWLKLILFIAFCRFALPPLAGDRIGAFGRKPDVNETALWFGIATLAGIAIRTLPLFIVHAVPTADEVLTADHRRPVLYFRSFEREVEKVHLFWSANSANLWRNRGGFYLGTRKRYDAITSERYRLAKLVGSRRPPLDEQMMFADAFRQVGPYIALGRPHEGFRDMDLGAAKKYVSDHEWQDVVRDWLTQCAAVVIEGADSASLGWEIDQVVSLVPPSHVLVVCPYSVENYLVFVQAHAPRFPRGLPTTRPTSRLMVFGPSWEPKELYNVNFNAAETLAPFFNRLHVRTNVRGSQ
jgi:hypothetical protein